MFVGVAMRVTVLRLVLVVLPREGLVAMGPMAVRFGFAVDGIALGVHVIVVVSVSVSRGVQAVSTLEQA